MSTMLDRLRMYQTYSHKVVPVVIICQFGLQYVQAIDCFQWYQRQVEGITSALLL